MWNTLRALGIPLGVSVDQNNDVITIYGVHTANFLRDLQKVWGTSTLTYMFHHTEKHSLSFHRFFALDVLQSIPDVLDMSGRYTPLKTIKSIETGLLENTWIKSLRISHPSILDRSALKQFKFPPMTHQSEFFDSYENTIQRLNLKGMLLASAPGTGKTYMYLATAVMLGVDITIAVVPKNSVKRVWEQTIRDHLGYSKKVWTSLDTTDPSLDQDFYIVHYEAVPKLYEFIQRHVPYFREKRTMILVDESHNLNELASQRTQKTIDLHTLIDVNYTLWGSGTPFKALGIEVIPFLMAADPYFTPKVQERFVKAYGKSSPRAAKVLSRRIRLISYRSEMKIETKRPDPVFKRIDLKIPKGDTYTLPEIRKVLDQFSKERIQHHRALTTRYETLYRDTVLAHKATLLTLGEKKKFQTYQEYFKIIRKGYIPEEMKDQIQYCNAYENKIAKDLPSDTKKEFLKACKIIRTFYLVIQGETLGHLMTLREQCHTAMVPHIDFAQEISSTPKKTLIFTSYVNTAKTIFTHLQQQGYTPLIVYGETNKDLVKIIEQFETDPNVNPLIATYASLSTAVPMTMATKEILVDQPFREYIRSQTIARVDRLGQTEQTEIVEVFLDTGNEMNLSTRNEEICNWSASQVKLLLGGELSGEIIGLYDTIQTTDAPREVIQNHKASFRRWLTY